jgi:predicted ATP-grasp superfamily ATP-dependent carboligase
MDRENAVLIAAVSGRALAASARRGGYAPLVADFFGDADTLAIAQQHVTIDLPLSHGMNAAALMTACEMLGTSSTQPPIGVVYGTGFEDRTDVLAALGRRWRLLGNTPDTVALLKDPQRFSELCEAGGIRHPETSDTPPDDPTHWLVKRCGGSGGGHVRPATPNDGPSASKYFQRRVEGVPVSALILADGRNAVLLGLSTQWAAPARDKPFRYGGAVRPAIVAPGCESDIAVCVARLMTEVPLVGLNSVDFLVDGDRHWLLEVNPRPGATLDVFDSTGVGDARNNSLFALHVAACRGTLPANLPALTGAHASALVYADHDIAYVPAHDWPDWTADRPRAGTSVPAGYPLCTVLAMAPTPADAKHRVLERVDAIVAAAREWRS